jgi:GNAT superfamily N-acetyltransferase
MADEIRIEQFTESNLADYERLTKLGDDGNLCYCSFWHAKWTSMDEYDRVKAEEPEKLKACVVERVRAQFHVGVIAYLNDNPCAWISVGPLIDFYWTWKRVAHIGEIAKTTAGILCFTIAPEYRGKKLQATILEKLLQYGRQKGWTAIEAYPFASEAIAAHGDPLKWPGMTAGYEAAGFTKIADHWLSSPAAPRHIYQISL